MKTSGNYLLRDNADTQLSSGPVDGQLKFSCICCISVEPFIYFSLFVDGTYFHPPEIRRQNRAEHLHMNQKRPFFQSMPTKITCEKHGGQKDGEENKAESEEKVHRNRHKYSQQCASYWIC